MRAFIAGASGRIGKLLTADLVKRGVSVIAASRHPEAVSASDKVFPLEFDLRAPAKTMVYPLKNADAVYYVAGSRGKDLLQVDAFGAVSLMKACELAGIKRFVMLSSFDATQPETWQDNPAFASLTDYYIAKFFADEWLIQNTNLTYTIIQASYLTDSKGSGLIQINPPAVGENTLEDVACVLAECLDMPTTYHKVINICQGQTPIEEALLMA